MRRRIAWLGLWAYQLLAADMTGITIVAKNVTTEINDAGGDQEYNELVVRFDVTVYNKGTTVFRLSSGPTFVDDATPMERGR